MTNMRGYSDDDVKMQIADTLRMHVGQGRLSWEDLALVTGDDPRKLRSYVERDPAAMPFPVFCRVFRVLPPEAFGRVARYMGFSSGPLETDDSATVRRALSVAARLVADGNEFLEDNELTAAERTQLADRAAQALPILTMIAGGRERG